MRFVLVILAILCGICLALKIATGTLDAQQVAGVGIICAALAAIAPANWGP